MIQIVTVLNSNDIFIMFINKSYNFTKCKFKSYAQICIDCIILYYGKSTYNAWFPIFIFCETLASSMY